MTCWGSNLPLRPGVSPRKYGGQSFVRHRILKLNSALGTQKNMDVGKICRNHQLFLRDTLVPFFLIQGKIDNILHRYEEQLLTKLPLSSSFPFPSNAHEFGVVSFFKVTLF